MAGIRGRSGLPERFQTPLSKRVSANLPMKERNIERTLRALSKSEINDASGIVQYVEAESFWPVR
jgi:hypothetical protein